MAAIGRSWEPLPLPASVREAGGGPLWTAWSCAERCACGFLVLAFAPLAAGLALAVAAISRRSPFVAHRRVGWRGEVLWMWKFRTMWDDQPPAGRWRLVEYLSDRWVPSDKSVPDPRVRHPLARWMRRFSVDETPQLVHVVLGQMALAGPRPLTAEELRQHYGADAAEMLGMKPGITGLWQVMGRNRLPYRQRQRLDLFLVRNRSLRLYSWILGRTLPSLLRGENAS